MICYAMLCNAIVCYDMLCYTTVYYIMIILCYLQIREPVRRGMLRMRGCAGSSVREHCRHMATQSWHCARIPHLLVCMAAVRLQMAICHYTSDVIGVISRIWGAVVQLAVP